MDKEKQGKAVFVSFCIEQYAKAKNMSTEDVVNLFEQYGIAEHFCEFYEVLHTQGGQWLISCFSNSYLAIFSFNSPVSFTYRHCLRFF